MMRYFEAASSVVERHGGTVEKFIGDAVMAVFGVPRRAGGPRARGRSARRSTCRRSWAPERRPARAMGRADRDPHRRQQRRGRGGRRRRRPGARDRRRGQRRGAPPAGGRPGETLIGDATRRLSARPRGRGGRAAVGTREGGAAGGLAAGRHGATGRRRPRTGRDARSRSRAAPPARGLRAGRVRAQPAACEDGRPAGIGKSRLARELGRRCRSAPPCSSAAACPTARASRSGRSAEIVRQVAGARTPRAGLERVLGGRARTPS